LSLADPGQILPFTNEAVQIFGGYGFTKDYPVEKYYRDVKLGTIGEGTSEIQKMVISREILKWGMVNGPRSTVDCRPLTVHISWYSLCKAYVNLGFENILLTFAAERRCKI